LEEEEGNSYSEFAFFDDFIKCLFIRITGVIASIVSGSILSQFQGILNFLGN